LESDRRVQYENMSYDNKPFAVVLNILQTNFKHRIWEGMWLLLQRQTCHDRKLNITRIQDILHVSLTSRPWGFLCIKHP